MIHRCSWVGALLMVMGCQNGSAKDGAAAHNGVESQNGAAARESSTAENGISAPSGLATKQEKAAKSTTSTNAEPLTEKSRNENSYVPRDVRLAHYQTLKLNLDKAAKLLENQVGPHVAIARARLALYRADCEEARAHLSSTLVKSEKSAQEMIQLAESCFGATAGATIVEDKAAGVWIRLQDHADQVLVPRLVQVAERARATLERDLGVSLPRPLRIDLVRDLFSLSAVSGLPVDAAETTGTVAVARWGRVTMVSPRAISDGFPWADTLAHEITHLLISRATAERAPLWLQEGIAKRQERRWRAVMLFDETLDHSRRAFTAQVAGRSVGVDQIGPSIAMLPSADQAATAFSEVTSFMEFWIARNGPRALYFLLRDIEVAQDSDAAMRSVSGFSVAEWQMIWRADLAQRFTSVEAEAPEDRNESLGPQAIARSLRLVELLTLDGYSELAEFRGAVDLDRAPHVAALRYLTARAAMLRQEGDETLYLGEPGDVDEPHAGWLAFYAAAENQSSPEQNAGEVLEQALSLDPLLPEVACAGLPWVGSETTFRDQGSQLEFDPRLCAAAKKMPIRGIR